MSKEKVNRRGYVKYAAAGVVIVAVGAGGAYYATRQPTPTPTLTPTPTSTPTPKPTLTPTSTPTPGADISLQNAINGIKALIDAGKVPKGTIVSIGCEEGFQTNAVKESLTKFYEVSPFSRDDFDVEVLGVPFVSLYDKWMAEAVSKTGGYDIIWGCATYMLADLVVAGLAMELDNYLMKYDPENTLMNNVVTSVRKTQAIVADKYYALPSDGDVFLMFYRKDILNDPTEKKDFEDKYGKELNVAQTWEDYMDHAEFFTREKGEKLMGETLDENFYGAVEWRLKYCTFDWFFTRLATSREDATRVYFDPDTMEPLFNQSPAAEILEEMKKLNDYMPPIPPFSYGENLAAYLDGIVAQWISWPGPARFAADPTVSKIVGKHGTAVTPHGVVNGKKIQRSQLATGYSALVSNYSKNTELAYLMNQALHSPTCTRIQVGISKSNIDPYCYTQFEDPDFRAGRFIGFEWVGADEWLDALRASLEIGFPELTIPGYYKYMDILETNISIFMAGEVNAQKALDDAAKQWREITEDLGFDQQKSYYLALTKLMPP